VEGVHRFLARSYRLVTGENATENEPSKEQLRSLHIAIKRVTSHPNSNVCARMLPTRHNVRNLTARSVNSPACIFSVCLLPDICLRRYPSARLLESTLQILCK